MNGEGGQRVTILSSVHAALDNRVFYREARTLANAGYDVTLIAVHDRDETRDGVRIKALPRVPRRQRAFLWRSLVRAAIETRADIFHFHDPELLLVMPYLRRVTGRPTIYDIHEANADFIAVKDYLPDIVRWPLSAGFRRLEPWLARKESGLIFADDAIAADFAGFQGPATTLFNYPGRELIDQGLGPANDTRERQPIVLYLGGMERNRGSALMVNAFAEVVAQMPEARLIVVGHFMPPELADEVLIEAKRQGIEQAVTLTGRVPFDTIGPYLAQTAVGWVTWQPYAKNEKNIPTKLFEYMAFRLPVVSSDLTSIRPFIAGRGNGILVEAENPTAHAAAILRLLRDPGLRERMGRAGRKLVETHFNWPAMEQRLLALYRAVLRGDRSP
jgi:glycosyltransferase involved in cell wall biosynthesis